MQEIYSKICKISLVSQLPTNPHTWDKPNLFTNTSLCSGPSQYVTFYQSLVNADFFTSVIGPDILIKLFKVYIIFLVWAAWILFNLYLAQKQRFPVWKLTEIASFISFHEGIWLIAKTH